MANIKKDEKTNTYYFKISLGTDPSTGKRRQTTRRGIKKKSDAIKMYNELKNQYYDGTLIHNKSITLENFYKDYEPYMKTRMRERTYISKKQAMESSIIPHFGGYRLDQVNALEVQRWQQKMLDDGLSIATVNLRLAFLKDLLNRAVELELIPTNKAIKVKSLKVAHQEMNIWTVDELDKFLQSFDKSNYREIMLYTLFKVLFYSGLRINEALALQWTDLVDVHLDVNKTLFMRSKDDWEFSEPKTKTSKRSVTLDDDTLTDLLTWKEQKEVGFIFSFDGKPIQHQTIGYHLKKHIEKSNVPMIRVHDLRHSHASFLIQLNINILAIAKRLGHKDATQVIETYGHLYPDYQFDIIKNIDNFKTGPKRGHE